jgi:hypothetical protein
MNYTFDANLISDLYKDVKGFRPSSQFFVLWNTNNDDYRQSVWDNLILESEINYAEEKQAEEAAAKDFEAQIKSAMDLGADSRETALRWIVDSLNLSNADKMYGGDYICYTLGIPYNYSNQFNSVL